MTDEEPSELDVPVLTAAPADDDPGRSWHQIGQSRAAVLAILFGVTGCLGLHLLFSSPKFSPAEKRAWAAVNIVYTLALVAGVAWVCRWAWGRVSAVL